MILGDEKREEWIWLSKGKIWVLLETTFQKEGPALSICGYIGNLLGTLSGQE